MDWSDVPEQAVRWAEICAEPAQEVQKLAWSRVWPQRAAYYFHPRQKLAAVFPAGASKEQVAQMREANVPFRDSNLTPEELLSENRQWVKLAETNAVRTLGEWLQFFPGRIGGTQWNWPNPVTSSLAGALVGGGIGYGLGSLANYMLPGRFGENLPMTAGILGGLAGGTPGAIWGANNMARGRSIFDGSLLSQPPNTPPRPDARDYDPTPPREVTASAFSLDNGSADVNINAMGQTLWETGATPQLAAKTMGALYAAQQLPDNSGRPGVATGHQLGMLAARAAGDYVKGYGVGAVMNRLIGSPLTAPQYGLANMGLGILNGVLPNLFGG